MNYGLAAFDESLKKVMALDLGEQVIEGHDSKLRLSNLCECGVPSFMERIQPAFRSSEEQDGFLIFLYIEALIQTGIHCYDGENHRKYLDKVHMPIHIAWHGWHGSKPQIFLKFVTHLDTARQECLLRTIRELIPAWIKSYDSLVGTRSGRRVIRGLSDDADVTRAYGDEAGLVPVLQAAQRELAMCVP